MRPRVTIIGSGIAAVATACEAIRSGAEVTVIRGRPGSTALSSGAWDIAGDPLRFAGTPWQEVRSPRESLQELIRRLPHHPYRLLSLHDQVGDLPSFLSGAVNRIARALDLPLHGEIGRPFLALTPLGTVKVTAYTLPTHGAGNLLEMQGARLMVVGIQGLPSHPAALIASLLKKNRHRSPSLSEITATQIAPERIPKTLSPVQVAHSFDEDEAIDSLHKVLVQQAEKVRPTHVALPPVMGIRQSAHILSRLRETTGIHWFETLGLPPSIPGIRLQESLDRYFRLTELREGTVTSARMERKRVVALHIRDDEGRDEEFPVDRVVLATGKFLGGGIAPGTFREKIFNLPIFHNGNEIGARPVGPVVSRHYLDPHPLQSMGLRVNPHLQPVDDRGHLLLENLWAAGSILGGYDAAREGCGVGVAVGTGTLAGRLASERFAAHA